MQLLFAFFRGGSGQRLAAFGRWYWLLAAAVLAAPRVGQARPPVRGVPVQQLAAGSGHSLLVRADGLLYAWGSNGDGQLGDGSTGSRAVPGVVAGGGAPAGTHFCQVAGGTFHTLALAATGRLYAWGRNNYGQLGDNSTTSRLAPVALAQGAAPADTRFTQVSAGVDHSLALAADGTLYAWGFNAYGQLGDGTATTRPAPVAVALGAAPAGTRFVQVAAGGNFSLALAADGTLYGWGQNTGGQLGDGTTTTRFTPGAVALGSAPAGTRFVQVAAGFGHALVLAADGTVYAWGDNTYGQLGDGTTTSSLVPVTVALQPGARFTRLSAGQNYSLALTADGLLFGWGYNGNGQLGDGTTTDRATPVPVAGGAAPPGTRFTQVATGANHALALAADGTVYAWCSNISGQLGNGTTAPSLVPVAVAAPAATGYTQAAAGFQHSLALRADGRLFGWGRNVAGQLGDATTTNRLLPVAVLPGSAGTPFVQVSAGTDFTVGLTANGTLHGWGRNTFGQLGDGTTASRTTPVAVAQGAIPVGTGFTQIASGDGHSLALAANGTIYAWGYNGNGQLGDGTFLNRQAPVAVLLGAAPAGTRFVQVAVGGAHSLALAADGTIYAWGNNSGNGRLGDGTTTGHATPVAVVPGAVPAGTRFAQIAAGTNHSLALAANGTVYAWGSDDYGQLGDNASYFRQLAPVAVLMGAAPAGTRFVQVIAGEYHSLALAADGALYSWGGNANGQLGDNSFTQRNTPVRESSGGTGWTAVAMGPFVRHSLALGAQGAVFSAGRNFSGQLGDGSTTDSPVFVRNLAPLPVHAAATGVAAFGLYPNPAPGAAMATGLPAGAPLTVFDTLGRAVLRTSGSASGTALLALPAGLYLVRCGNTAQRLLVE